MISLKHLGRYKDLAWLLVKYGRKDIVKEIGVEVPVDKDWTSKAKADELTSDLQALGPTYIKLGQLLSSQVDVLSESYQEALSNLQDNVETFPFEEVKKIIEAELQVNLKSAFSEFNEKPLAGASLSQVHEARLHSGKHVVVKVQRPGIYAQIMEDLDMLDEIASFLDKTKLLGNYYWKDKIKAMKATMMNELDFRKEAHNLKIFNNNMQEFNQIIIPLPVEDYTTSKVLTMEYISGRKITTIHPLMKIDIDGEQLADELFKGYLKQIFIDGLVHIDPHPGNVYLSDSNQLVLLDLGMIERIPPQLQQDLLKLLIAMSEGKGEEVAELVMQMGHREEDFEFYKFQEEIAEVTAQYKDLEWHQMSMGKLMLKIARIASEYKLRLPNKFNTLGKTLLNLDAIVQVLDPNINPNNFIKDHTVSLLQRRLQKLWSESSMAKSFLEVYDIIYILPAKIREFLEFITKGEMKLKVQTFDESRVLSGFEKVANRIALGLVLAALIIGASLLMRVETTFHLFGYPGLAILLFLGAVVGGVLFIANILMHDRRRRK